MIPTLSNLSTRSLLVVLVILIVAACASNWIGGGQNKMERT